MSYSDHLRRFAEKLGMIPTKEEKEMKAIKEWEVTVIVYDPESGWNAGGYTLDIRAKKESQVRRLTLDAIYCRGLFVQRFVKIERKGQ